MHAVGPAAVARDVAVLIKEGGQVRGRAQLLGCAGAPQRSVEGLLIQDVFIPYNNKS